MFLISLYFTKKFQLKKIAISSITHFYIYKKYKNPSYLRSNKQNAVNAFEMNYLGFAWRALSHGFIYKFVVTVNKESNSHVFRFFAVPEW